MSKTPSRLYAIDSGELQRRLDVLERLLAESAINRYDTNVLKDQRHQLVDELKRRGYRMPKRPLGRR